MQDLPSKRVVVTLGNAPCRKCHQLQQPQHVWQRLSIVDHLLRQIVSGLLSTLDICGRITLLSTDSVCCRKQGHMESHTSGRMLSLVIEVSPYLSLEHVQFD